MTESTSRTRQPAGTPVGGQFAESAKAAPDAAVQLNAPAAAMPTDEDVVYLGELRGFMEGGYSDETIDGVLSSIRGAEMACVWEYLDDCGVGGGSEIVGRVGEGPWRGIHPDLWDHLYNPDSEVDVAATPLLSDDLYDVQDLDDVIRNGANIALENREAADDEDDDDTIFVFDHGDVEYEVDRLGDSSYGLYKDGQHVADFFHYGDPEDHYEIQGAAEATLAERGIR